MTLISDLMKRSTNHAVSRAGRKKIRGNVNIQTYQPQYPVIKFCMIIRLKSFTIGN